MISNTPFALCVATPSDSAKKTSLIDLYIGFINHWSSSPHFIFFEGNLYPKLNPIEDLNLLY